MTETPAPPIAADVDLRGYDFMPFYGHHLFGSEFNARASDAAWRAGVTLWWAAWNQVPAGSLPDDDVALCRLADLGRDVKAWKKVREQALHGFSLCSDGRLYHGYLCKLAVEAWDRRVKERERKAKYRAGRERPGDGDKTGTTAGHERDSTRDGTAERRGEDRRGQDRNISPDTFSQNSAGEVAAGAPTPARKPRKMCPENWQPSERLQARIESEGVARRLAEGGTSIEMELERMRSCTFSTARVDWDATAWNWLLTECKKINQKEALYGAGRQAAQR